MTATTERPQRSQKGNVLDRTAGFFTNLMDKYLPDPLVIAIMLTGLTMVLAILAQGSSPLEVVEYWGGGFWDLLAFTMQMTVVLLAGYILAKTPLVDRLLDALTIRITSPRTAIIVATLVGGIGSWLNWGFGLVMGGIIAQKLAMNVKGLHYPLAIAAGYSGFAVYGIGLSGSVPLLIATEGHFLQEQVGIIPLADTIFSPYLLLTNLAVLLFLPLFNMALHPKDPAKIKEMDRTSHAVDAPIKELDQRTTLAAKLNNSPIIGIGIGLIALVYAFNYFFQGGTLNLDAVNFMFLFLGIILFARPSAFLAAVNDGVKIVSGIIIQYPFYAGIMGILVGSGLVVSFADWFGTFSTAETLPFWSFISGGIINLLAPSGGGQWAVQGPVMMEAAQAMGANNAATAVAVQIGDQWTNMVQPFWILPVLAISGLKLRDVMGYMVLILVFLGVIFGAAVLLWGFLAV
ncbi:short-chain fatty acids transporter [Citricoccus zhacaiensis]|uniref:Short-chain fatty acids transporter n=1 Tax=Citricoccus zhacaiensis TaxID=489142 RepID=A0ABQ2MBQ2_9MICC|nr:TIGR00366 family protein [Citricoccus zhacaiensis]GGO49284.1 short-chain fatty acids transporter [Citricoccus zhacaiensis]